MSTAVQAGVWQCGPDGPENRTKAFVLLAIADNADDFGFAFPSVDTIAQKSRCEKRTVLRSLDELEQEGWIRVRRKIVNGKGNLYWINLEKIGVAVSPKAMQSPVVTRLLKQSGVTESPIFWPKKSGDMKADSGDKSTTSQVTPQQTQVTSEQSQVTPETDSGDIACHPNRNNRQFLESSGTVSEPSSPENPLPPVGVEITQAWSDFKLELKRELGGAVPLAIERRRFQPLRKGCDDFDTAFRNWWIDELRPIGSGVYAFVTSAEEPDITDRGITKYHARVERLLRKHFHLFTSAAITFDVRPNSTQHQPAA